MTQPVTNLVADIGGTNLRIGMVADSGNVEELTVYQCGDYKGFADIVIDYIAKQDIGKHQLNACFAIACPVDNDLISMTNLPWQFSKKALKAQLNLSSMLFINDYTAIAHAVPHLTADQKVQIGEGGAVEHAPIAICGPGTGLGVAHVVYDQGHWISLGGEGGHVDFAPTNEIEIAILSFLLKKYQHVSYEQLLSGLGLEQIYLALADYKQLEKQPLSAQDISEKALNKSCSLCEQTLAQFCEILGSFAGNLSLTLSTFGGVYIAGGIVPRFIEYVKQSNFRNRFEAKGRFEAFNRSIATYVVTEAQPGILGAAAFLRQQISQSESN